MQELYFCIQRPLNYESIRREKSLKQTSEHHKYSTQQLLD